MSSLSEHMERAERAQRAKRDFDDRMVVAYQRALHAAHGGAGVSVHVGQDVWDYMHSLAIRDAALGPISTCWGYPVTLEMAWAPGRIVVRTEEEIW